METKQTFTDNRLRTLQHNGSDKRIILFDERQPGLALQLTPAGTKTFQFRHWDKTRQQTKIVSLGKYPDLPLNRAREQAAILLTEMNSGVDIQDKARTTRQEETFAELFHRFIEEHSRPHKRTWGEDLSRYKLYMERPLGVKKISWFSTENVRMWHLGITKQRLQRDDGFVSKTTANHALKLLSVIFSTMRPEMPNPCARVKKFSETSRERFLKPEEIYRLFEALNHPDTPELFRDYILLSLFTGGRRDNVLGMRWLDLDLSQGLWTIPGEQSKNGKSMIIPLTTEAMDILQRRRAETTSMFVLASPLGKSGHYAEPKRAWQTVVKRAGLTEVRLHDLRRTLGSFMAHSGANIVAIGKALGHQSVQSTMVYAKMLTDPVRSRMQAAVDLMKKATEQTPEERVVPIRRMRNK